MRKTVFSWAGILIAGLCIATLAAASGSFNYSATGPNMANRDVQYTKELTRSGTVGSGTVGSVSYKWDVDPGCTPVGVTCVQNGTPGLYVSLCYSTSTAAAPYLGSCVDVTAAKSGSTSFFVGQTFNATNKPRLFLVFYAAGSGSLGWSGKPCSAKLNFN